MSLTRTALKERGVDKETIDFIMDAHGETIESTKEKLEAAAQKKIDALQAKVDSLPADNEKNDWKDKYDTLKGEFDTYKTNVETEKVTAAKQSALQTALKAEGANEKLIPLLIKSIDDSKLEIDGDKIKDWDNIVKPVKEQFAEVFGTVTTQGAGIAKPPKTEQAKPAEHKDMNAFIRGVAE